jgi:hypothetical protein
MQFICNTTNNIEREPNATHLCFYEPIGIRLYNITTPDKPGKYGPINVRLFNLTYYEIVVNFKQVPKINYTLLYEANFTVLIKPGYLNDESNSFYKVPLPLNDVYSNKMVL